MLDQKDFQLSTHLFVPPNRNRMRLCLRWKADLPHVQQRGDSKERRWSDTAVGRTILCSLHGSKKRRRIKGGNSLAFVWTLAIGSVALECTPTVREKDVALTFPLLIPHCRDDNADWTGRPTQSSHLNFLVMLPLQKRQGKYSYASDIRIAAWNQCTRICSCIMPCDRLEGEGTWLAWFNVLTSHYSRKQKQITLSLASHSRSLAPFFVILFLT